MPLKPPLALFDTLEQVKLTQVSHPYPDDLQQAIEFIYQYRGSHATFNAYRREIERLLQWSAHIAKKSLQHLKQNHIEAYLQFCQAPPDEWIALKKCDRFITQEGLRKPNPYWRPFVASQSKAARKMGHTIAKHNYHLSAKALQAIFAILSSFYNYLIERDYLAYNPVNQIRQKSKFIRSSQQRAPVRRLSELQWSYVIETAEGMANNNLEHERTLFIMNALYAMYLRISELATSARWQPTMKDFFRDYDGNWWFRTVGKGNKERQIVVSTAMLNALKRYRESLQLSPLPDAMDHTPLLSKKRGKGRLTSTRHIRDIVQSCFDKAIQRMQMDGFNDEARELQAATVHWLRHTGISEDVKHRPREHVRDDAGHGSSAITDRYIDVELRQRHESGKNKAIKPT
ncbi:MAG: integrase [Coxiella sp. RIFCSPHIGHO2_12_FULL_42_15]|nr:MAG: integrase [Coxiella sp. RIFCSPHIGHO2_12_FULL_42_15]